MKLFGSLYTGLGSSTSDVDLYVALPISYNNDVILKARTTFEASPEVYQNIHTRTRLPALTFNYVPANMTCDVNFRNDGIFESDLLHYLLNIDDRALKLAIIVKYWAKLYTLIRPKYLTSYGMVMLVVFYLQQISMLPSVVELQNNHPTLIHNETNQFNVAFERKYIVSNNHESLYEMLGGFFEYYDNFDFDEFIVCPFIGEPVRKSLFKSVDTVPKEFVVYKSNVEKNISKPFNVTALCIQSLLMLNDNCAWRVNTVSTFRANFKNAARSFRENDKCTFLNALGVCQID